MMMRHSAWLACRSPPRLSRCRTSCLRRRGSGRRRTGGAGIASGHTRFRLDSDRAGPGAITVTLTAICDTSGAQQITSDHPGTRRYEHPLSLQPRFAGLRFYTFPGGCVTYQFSFAPGASPILADAVDNAFSFQPRSTLVDFIRRTEGLALCGRGAACPG
jgi:hypothetical protein